MNWISVKERLPEREDADESGKVLVWREMNESQQNLSKSIMDYKMVKYSDGSTFWMPLPEPPKEHQIK